MSGRLSNGQVRVLVVDDSAYNRQAITGMLQTSPQIEVVGRAANGEEALREAVRLSPDAVTLDLEMPKMDGFTFLRILMNRKPTPVIVISSYSNRNNVFKALELGALDFIAKPTRRIAPELDDIRDELVAKVLMVRQLRAGKPRPVEPQSTFTERTETATLPAITAEDEIGLVVMGASTGGPPALQSILQALPKDLLVAYLITQHMPVNFTRAFAERLNRSMELTVLEAAGGETIRAGCVYVAPGGSDLAVARQGSLLLTEVRPAPPDAKYVPSIDALFSSAAEAAGSRVAAVLLTGMGTDGCEGMRAVKAFGGLTIAESEQTAVIFGMPREAIDSGRVDLVLRQDEVAREVERFALTIAGTGREEPG